MIIAGVAVGEAEFGHLLCCDVGELTAPVPHRDVPQRRQPVDVLVAMYISEHGAVPAGEDHRALVVGAMVLRVQQMGGVDGSEPLDLVLVHVRRSRAPV
jgi:hypothetical protein